jgi:hypothetical protein
MAERVKEMAESIVELAAAMRKAGVVVATFNEGPVSSLQLGQAPYQMHDTEPAPSDERLTPEELQRKAQDEYNVTLYASAGGG